MNTDFMRGVVVPILTIIDKDEKINEAGMRAQVDYVIEGGVSGILAFGSNGEFYMVEENEMERGLKIMVDQAAGRVPVRLLPLFLLFPGSVYFFCSPASQ